MPSTDASSQIRAYCQEHAGEMLQLLERIVNIDSCSTNPAGVDEVASALQPGLDEAGFESTRVVPPKLEEGAWLAEFFLPGIVSFDLVAHHLVARKAGSGRGHALLIGHMDTAFPPGEPERNPFRLEGDLAYGCAVADMKGGLVVLLYALKALATSGVDAPRITVVYDTDEQAGSHTARKLIEQIVREDSVDWAFKVERGVAGPSGGYLWNQRPALGVGMLEAHGIERHVGTGYWDAASAVVALAQKAVKLQALSNKETGDIVNVGIFRGGTRRNLVAGYARADLDIRSRSQKGWDRLAEHVRSIAEEETIPGTRGELKIINHRPAMVPTKKTERLMATIERAAADLGKEVAFDEIGGGSDANFTAALDVPTIDGFGPIGANTMTRDEFIEVESLPERAALLALTLHRLATEQN